jgi:hypothetical protein
MDPGNWATDLAAGSTYGYQLLWIVALSSAMAMLLQSLCCRLGIATGMDLALLTALAADHAAVSGRLSHAKWLWRLALKRFGELGALNSDAAKAVAESMRQGG